MIVHLFEDQKFVDITIENFESVSSGMNKYIVFSDNKKLRYVSRKEDVIVLPNSSYKLDVDLVYEDCQLLIIHFLTPLNLFILKNKPPQVKVIWSVWGADAYDHFRGQNIFEPLTRNIRDKSLYQLLKPSILYTYYHFLRYRVKPVKKELKLLKSFDYVIRDEDTTLGNLLQDYLFEKDGVKFVGYDIPHPLDPILIIRMGLEKNNTIENNNKMMIDTTKMLIGYIDDVQKEWKTFE